MALHLRASVVLGLLDHFFCFIFFWPPDFLGHNDHIFYRMAVFYRNVDGLRLYWDGLSLQCTARVSDGFALALGDQNPYRLCFF